MLFWHFRFLVICIAYNIATSDRPTNHNDSNVGTRALSKQCETKYVSTVEILLPFRNDFSVKTYKYKARFELRLFRFRGDYDMCLNSPTRSMPLSIFISIVGHIIINSNSKPARVVTRRSTIELFKSLNYRWSYFPLKSHTRARQPDSVWKERQESIAGTWIQFFLVSLSS